MRAVNTFQLAILADIDTMLRFSRWPDGRPMSDRHWLWLVDFRDYCVDLWGVRL